VPISKVQVGVGALAWGWCPGHTGQGAQLACSALCALPFLAAAATLRPFAATSSLGGTFA
jgi:hypothetical protein